MVQGLSCSVACGIFPGQGLNPALAGGFLTTAPPRKSANNFFALNSLAEELS